MEKTRDSLYASPAQWKVIQWLFHYPNIYLCWSDMYSTWVYWSAAWADESARQHMISVMGEIGDYFGVHDTAQTTKPRIKPLEGPTPRCCFQTFKALVKENVICRHNKDHYQLSPDIRKQLEVDELEGLFPKASGR